MVKLKDLSAEKIKEMSLIDLCYAYMVEEGIEKLNIYDFLDYIKPLRNVDEEEFTAQAAKNYEPHRICNYLQSLASSFHKFYNNNKVITENKEQTQSYLALITAVKITLRNALDLIGVSAPEKM